MSQLMVALFQRFPAVEYIAQPVAELALERELASKTYYFSRVGGGHDQKDECKPFTLVVKGVSVAEDGKSVWVVDPVAMFVQLVLMKKNNFECSRTSGRTLYKLLVVSKPSHELPFLLDGDNVRTSRGELLNLIYNKYLSAKEVEYAGMLVETVYRMWIMELEDSANEIISERAFRLLNQFEVEHKRQDTYFQLMLDSIVYCLMVSPKETKLKIHLVSNCPKLVESCPLLT